jgi:hypothetical protein
MGYLREHSEAGRVRAVARVVGEPGRFCVRLTEGSASSRRPHEGGLYSTRDLAFAVADVLARHQLRGHECGAACTGWLDPSPEALGSEP